MVSEIQQLRDENEALRRIINTHLGPQGSSATAQIPHPQLSAIAHGAYIVTTPVERRAYTTTTVTLPQLAEVVSTILSDLQLIKVLG